MNTRTMHTQIPGYQMVSLDLADVAVPDAVDLAISRARDDGHGTWICEDGKRVAALLPVNAGEAFQKIADEMSAAVSEMINEVLQAHEGQHDGKRYGARIEVEARGVDHSDLLTSAWEQARSFFGETEFELDHGWRAHMDGGVYRATILATEVLGSE